VLHLGVDMNSGVTRGAGTRLTREASADVVACLRHDVRQAVAVILTSVCAAEEDQSTCPEARRWLGHIADEARRISRICEHAFRAGDAPRILRSLEEVTLGVIDSTRVVVSTVIDYRASGEDISVDGAAIERALANVIENACRAAGPEGTVRVEINRVGDGGATITVDDNGPGFQALAVEGRAGLGLEVTRRVLDSLGGSLRISQRGPLGGARVQLDLPSSSCRPTSEGAP
jgi:signal transduction histidine kinase